MQVRKQANSLNVRKHIFLSVYLSRYSLPAGNDQVLMLPLQGRILLSVSLALEKVFASMEPAVVIPPYTPILTILSARASRHA